MQVADCYIHVRYHQLAPREFNRLSDRLYHVATNLSGVVKRAHDLDFTFEEGSLIQRILLAGTLLASSLDAVSHYHDLRESVVEMMHDGEQFSEWAIARFHQETKTTPNQEVYKRTTSRDMNRLRRIVSNFDQAASGNMSHSGVLHARSEIVHDLAGLARANADDPEIQRILHVLPRDRIPDLPSDPLEAIAIDEREQKHRPSFHEEPELPPRHRPRRRFHKHAVLPVFRRR
jgi:hypothetical protein